MVIHHGELYLRDHIPPRSRYFNEGRFGRIFPTLRPFLPDTERVRQALLEVGKPGGIMDAQDAGGQNPRNPDNPDIPAGFTFFGQFLDHDITFDPTSSLERQVDPESVANFRTPTLELDNVYGSGRAASPHLYDGIKLLVDAAAPRDLPRNSINTALIGDPRNDENLIVSQLHLAFIKFHNAVVSQIGSAAIDPFQEAQRLVRWHYQWIVVEKFLPLIVGKDAVRKALEKRRCYDWRNEPFIPVEFSVAAYRFGHSQVRPFYRVNAQFAAPIFNAALPPDDPDPNDLSGGKRAERRFVEWQNFFPLGGGQPQQGKLIDTTLSSPLFALPFSGPNLPTNPNSLAQRNLLRHLTFGVPSGQDVADALEETPLSEKDLNDLPELLRRSTPLWFYILREAAVHGDGGRRLGPVGGRIVAEVLIGLLQGDRMSYLRAKPQWKPTLGSKKDDFTMADLLKVAGVA
jgi:hypothetical protein